MTSQRLVRSLPKRTSYEHDQQLVTLYHKWVSDPQAYGEEMATTVRRIVSWVLDRQPTHSIYYRIEDRDDLRQDLEAVCFRKLQTVTEPTNKRIFNRLRLAVLFELKTKARKLSRYIDREEIENTLCSPVASEPLPDFGEVDLNNLAEYLSSGLGKRKICKELGLTPKIYEERVAQLRQYYQET